MVSTFPYVYPLITFFFVFSVTAQTIPALVLLNELTANPPLVYLFAHGVGMSPNTNAKQAKPYLDNNIITGPCYSFNFGDSIRSMNLGQENDCAIFISAYKQLVALHPTARIILVGISRGAVTILNSIALHPKIDWSPVQAALLESPYAHVTTIAEQIARSYMFFIPFHKTLMRKLMNLLPSYNVDGIQPITTIQKMKTHFPIFIAYSEIDKTVPASSTQQLIEKLESLNQAVTTWSSKTGKHSKLATNNAFASAAHAFIEKHASI